VRGNEHARAPAGFVAQYVPHEESIVFIKRRGRLIADHDRGLTGDRSGHGDTMALAAGKLAEPLVEFGFQPHSFQCLPATLIAFAALDFGISQRQEDVLQDAEIVDQSAILKQIGNAMPAIMRQPVMTVWQIFLDSPLPLFRRIRADVPHHLHAAAFGTVQTAQHFQQGRFPGP
jgi:hypothetical protein